MTGRDAPVADHVTGDPAWAPFWDRMTALLDPLLPAYAAGGKKYLTVALGCTGGKHRSSSRRTPRPTPLSPAAGRWT
jgi:UPF0042 nucleotide-binding protein